MKRQVGILFNALLPALMLVVLLPATTRAQGLYSTAGYGLAGARGTVLRDVDGAMVNPALLGLPRGRWFSLRLMHASLHVDQNFMSVGRWNRWQGTHLTDADKNELLDALGEAASVRGVTEINLPALKAGPFSVGGYLYAGARGRIPSTLFEIALKGTELDRTYRFGELGVNTEVVSVIQSTLAFRLPSLANLLESTGIPLQHLSGGVGVKYFLGHLHVGEGRGNADLWMGTYGMTGEVDLRFRTAGVPGGLIDDESDDPLVLADTTFSPVSGRGLGIDLGIAADLTPRASVHVALLNIGRGINWDRSTYQATVTARADTLSLGTFIEVGDEDASAALDTLTAHDITFERIDGFRTPIPLMLRVGGTYRFGRLALNAELEQAFRTGLGHNRVPRLGLGLEFRPIGIFPLRAGVSIGGSAGVRGAVGFGLDLRLLVWDVAIGNSGLTPGGLRGLGASTGLKITL